MIIGSNRHLSMYNRCSNGFVTSKDVKNGRKYTVTVTLNTGRVITLNGIENYDIVEVRDSVTVTETYKYSKYKRLIKKETKLEKGWG